MQMSEEVFLLSYEIQKGSPGFLNSSSGGAQVQLEPDSPRLSQWFMSKGLYIWKVYNN